MQICFLGWHWAAYHPRFWDDTSERIVVSDILLVRYRLYEKNVYRVIRKRVDNVRFYRFCAECAARTEVTCGNEVFGSKTKTVLV